jgi:hypothetical protein
MNDLPPEPNGATNPPTDETSSSVAILFWMLITTGAAVGMLLGFFGFASDASSASAGPGAPLGGVASGLEVVFLLFCGVVFFCCLAFRPKAVVLTPRRVSVFGVIVMTAVLGVWGLIRSTKYELTVRFIGLDGSPLEHAEVHYQTISLGQGIGRLYPEAKGTLETDSSGAVHITASHAQMVDVHLFQTGKFQYGVQLQAAFDDCHQITGDPRIEVTIQKPSEAYYDTENRLGWMIPAGKKISLTVKPRAEAK